MIPTNNNGNNNGRAKFFDWLDGFIGRATAKQPPIASTQSSLQQGTPKPTQSLQLESPKEVGVLGTTLTNNLPKPDMSNLFNVDWDFIGKLEGRKLNGYVPTDKNKTVLGQSGVTVGTGFDIGQRSVADLKKLGLPSELVTKLSPYAGKKKEAALQVLKKQPLKLTDDEVNLIDTKVKGQAIEQLAKSYNKKAKVKFEELAPEQQTVLASVAFQYGDLSKRTPNFWKSVLDNNWDKAYNQLLNFGDKYKKRRHTEAQLLSNLVNKGTKLT